EGYADDFATWAHAASVKIAAGVDVAVMTALGQDLLTRGAADPLRPRPQRTRLKEIAGVLAEADADTALAVATDTDLAALFAGRPLAALASSTVEQLITVERTAAGVGAWYEFFPRSE